MYVSYNLKHRYIQREATPRRGICGPRPPRKRALLVQNSHRKLKDDDHVHVYIHQERATCRMLRARPETSTPPPVAAPPTPPPPHAVHALR